ncbi:pentatricopeptide repeat-containing protein [Canna indica]|uniref:Pentatricopeptide repeat-containing protein n=1 Tax=Canna indica TaxID=4628 RepID=A0AAQ3KZH9_9LILI|nr:pentatricopeptide repeat-containing protein [Canna indica]
MAAVSSLSHALQLHALILKTRSNHHSYSSSDHSAVSAANAVVRAYARSDRPRDALLFFLHLQPHGPAPNHFTLTFLLASCARRRAAPEGRQLHSLAHKRGFLADRHVRNSLIHMYSSCGQLDLAAKVFDGILHKDVVSWTSMINGAVEVNQPLDALRFFDSMQSDGVAPNDATIVSVLGACAEVGALSVGRRVHQMAVQARLDSEPKVATSLIDMYAKCGCILTAERLFEQMVDKDVFTWTAMISGLASYGRWEDALSLFHKMVEEEVKPNERTIIAALCACRSAGWVSEGYRIYNYMHRYGLRPKFQHYGCMVDLLARAGHLDEAEGFLRRMPIEPDAVMWRTLIWASRLHGELNRAERLVNELQKFELSSTDGGSYVLIGNIYASVGKWEKKARVRELMDARKINKLPGCSRIEVNGVVHEFEAGDSGHPEAQRIYEKIDEIAEKLRSEGYHPKTSEVLLDMEDNEKALQLHHHSERLAVAFGLISTNPGEKILIVKNLRSCEDCHSAMKLISKIFEREITIRDRIRFHHFVNGSCSCKDHW